MKVRELIVALCQGDIEREVILSHKGVWDKITRGIPSERILDDFEEHLEVTLQDIGHDFPPAFILFREND